MKKWLSGEVLVRLALVGATALAVALGVPPEAVVCGVGAAAATAAP